MHDLCFYPVCPFSLKDRQPDAECTPRLRIRNVSIMCGCTWLHGFRSLNCCENMSRLVSGLANAPNIVPSIWCVYNQRFCWGGVGSKHVFYRFLMHRKSTCLISVSCRFRTLLWQSSSNKVQSVCKTCEQYQLNAASWYRSVRVLPWYVFNASSPSHLHSLSYSVLSVSSVPLSFLSPSVPHSHSPSILQSFSPSFTPSLHSLLSRQFQLEFWCWLRFFKTISCGLDVGWYGVGWASNVHLSCQNSDLLFHCQSWPRRCSQHAKTYRIVEIYLLGYFFYDVIIETYFLTINNISFWPCSGIVRWKSSVIVVKFKDSKTSVSPECQINFRKNICDFTGPVSGPAGCFIVSILVNFEIFIFKCYYNYYGSQKNVQN